MRRKANHKHIYSDVLISLIEKDPAEYGSHIVMGECSICGKLKSEKNVVLERTERGTLRLLSQPEVILRYSHLKRLFLSDEEYVSRKM